MARRIIGQCNTADFREIGNVASSMTQLQVQNYVSKLSTRKQAALMVIRHFQECGIPFDIALKLREVLIWEMPDKGLAFEYILLNPRDSDTRCILQNMGPRSLKVPRLLRKGR